MTAYWYRNACYPHSRWNKAEVTYHSHTGAYLVMHEVGCLDLQVVFMLLYVRT